MDLAKNIRKMREQKGITIEEIAGHMKKTVPTIKEWENGKVGHLTTRQIEQLAEVLKTEPAVLMGWIEE